MAYDRSGFDKLREESNGISPVQDIFQNIANKTGQMIQGYKNIGNSLGIKTAGYNAPAQQPVVNPTIVNNNMVAQNTVANTPNSNDFTVDNILSKVPMGGAITPNYVNPNNPLAMSIEGSNVQGLPNNTVPQVQNQPQAQRTQYSGPATSIFNSGFGQSSNTPSNSNQGANPNMFGNYNFAQDKYNENLRDTAQGNINNLESRWGERTRTLLDNNIGDFLTNAMLGNRDRQMIRTQQQNFTNANQMASRNLEQQNQLGLQDLMSQRSSYFEQLRAEQDANRTSNDNSRLTLEQQKLNQQLNQNNIDNQYRRDYLNNYSLPQLEQQRANQEAQLDLQRQINGKSILQGNLSNQIVNGLNPDTQALANARTSVLEKAITDPEMEKLRVADPYAYEQNINQRVGDMFRQQVQPLVTASGLIEQPIQTKNVPMVKEKVMTENGEKEITRPFNPLLDNPNSIVNDKGQKIDVKTGAVLPK